MITRTYDLLVWTLQHTSRFPRSHRHTLGLRIETKLYDIIDLLIEAKFTRGRAELLRQAALRVEQLRFLMRVSVESKLLAQNSHEFAMKQIDQIGQEIGSWRKNAESRESQ